jgi:hypothetical protein
VKVSYTGLWKRSKLKWQEDVVRKKEEIGLILIKVYLDYGGTIGAEERYGSKGVYQISKYGAV